MAALPLHVLSAPAALTVKDRLETTARRVDEVDDLGPHTALTGQPLPPRLPNVATGTIGAEQIRHIRSFFT